MTSGSATREAVVLVDRSERGKLALSGSEARAALNGLITNEVEALEAGAGVYAAVLTPKGKMIGDLRVLATAGELLLDMERGALQPIFDVLRHGLVGYDAQIGKRTLECALLSLIGEGSAGLVGATELAPEEHSHAELDVAGIAARVVRTDLGVDLICAAEQTQALTGALLGEGARAGIEQDAEVARVESGRPRFGIDLDDSVIPQEAGLNERAVSFTKGCYVGQETVARLHYRGKPNRHLRGLRLSAASEPGAALRLGEREVGRLSSAVSSPRLGPIGMALVRREAEPGAVLAVGENGVTGELVELPFA
jgi:folate-binding protein YgfZ